MSTSLGTSTSVRVLPSTLALRASPAVPSASQTYEPLVKAVLRHRLLVRIFATSAVFSWVLVILATTVRQGGLRSHGLVGILLSPILPRTLALTFVVWLLTAVPVVVMRKASLTGTSNFYTNALLSDSQDSQHSNVNIRYVARNAIQLCHPEKQYRTHACDLCGFSNSSNTCPRSDCLYL